MTEVAVNSATVQEETQVQEQQEEYQDRFLEGSQRIVSYDLLEARGKLEECTDPDAKNYKTAKEMFRKGYELCMTIPRSLEDDVLEKHEEDIKTASETMVEAWLLDERAAPMSERILILGQQYEKVLLKNIPEEEKEGFFVKDSLLFSAWILLVGRQFKHCVTTLTLAIDTYPDLPARVFFLRASCQLSLGKTRLGIKDLEKALERDPKFSVAYSVLGSVYLSLENERENAIKNFKLYLQNGHPDTSDTVHSLYALSVLLNHKKKKSEAHGYYVKAKEAEAKFKELYGAHTGLSEIKRDAIVAHESEEEAQKLIATYAPKKQADQRMQQLIESGVLNSFPPNPNRCSHCGAAHAKDKPNAPLLACGACRSIWYCSRDCQVGDYKLYHKAQYWETETKKIKITTHDKITGSRLDLLANTLPSKPFLDLKAPLAPAWHHVYFPPRTQEDDLAEDGYEREFFPPKPFSQRMWAGASFRWSKTNPLMVGDQVTMETYLDRVEVGEGRLGESVKVWLNKEIFNQTGWSMLEQRCLVYHQQQIKPSIIQKGIRVNRKPDFSMSLVPSSILLFRYSALTFNSHKIHFDHQYATQIEKHPACLVHGPLSGTLLLELLGKELIKEEHIGSFEYKCLAPLYVNHQINLCGRKLQNRKGNDGYELWITNEKGYLAVKGLAMLA
ncbi:hypothetical protein G6F46_003751 [Rhizopus delemar]|uniref:MYND-type domain-containing protein n=2 Tax=Rhizopus TaxID=4842 RepID=A0A9P6Z816_9FUNG|nr:hypothetical protein G6F55_001192 [Rhizopus delemar]KAG1552269.1 hypothetical protein G6F51_001334 [Rhizopus arrhizus]KAG1501196.1 hypothetical protein G6F54_003198 [Rhizopus delemar]KAG1514882.1 hypothetical protein G6F53_003333 [Rhizopus delemar]KAG1528432.1 hypothetical protein G6F52_000657 [Rhizopus delemar]